MARKVSSRRRISRWMAVGAVGAVAAAGVGLGSTAAQAAAGPSWSTVGPKAVSGTVSAVTSLHYGNSVTTNWAFVTTAYETNFRGYPSVWSRTGTESWARTNLAASAPGETFVSATAISPTDVLAFSTLPNSTSREWRFNGATWKVIKTFDAPIGGASVTSPTNVWVFGSADPGRQLGVYRYNGATWTKVASTLHGGQSLTSSDTYAYTGTTIAQWNGESWAGTNLARFIPGLHPDIAAVYDKFGSLYAVGESESELVILAYSGHAWARVGSVAGVAVDENQVSSDGGGGIWVPVVDGAKQGAAEVLHYVQSVHKLVVTALPGSALSITRVDDSYELTGGSVSSGKASPATYTELEYYN